MDGTPPVCRAVLAPVWGPRWVLSQHRGLRHPSVHRGGSPRSQRLCVTRPSCQPDVVPLGSTRTRAALSAAWAAAGKRGSDHAGLSRPCSPALCLGELCTASRCSLYRGHGARWLPQPQSSRARLGTALPTPPCPAPTRRSLQRTGRALRLPPPPQCCPGCRVLCGALVAAVSRPASGPVGASVRCRAVEGVGTPLGSTWSPVLLREASETISKTSVIHQPQRGEKKVKRRTPKI